MLQMMWLVALCTVGDDILNETEETESYCRMLYLYCRLTRTWPVPGTCVIAMLRTSSLISPTLTFTDQTTGKSVCVLMFLHYFGMASVENDFLLHKLLTLGDVHK